MKIPGEKFFLQWLILINLSLVIFYFISHFWLSSETIRSLFNLDGEGTIPSWFSTIQLFSLFALSLIYSLRIENKHLRRFYYLLSLIFLFFSADETIMMHETIAKSFVTRGFHSWILIYPVIMIIFGVIFFKGLSAFLNEKEGLTIFIIGAGLFAAGGVGWEMWGYYLETESVLYKIEVVLEESFELFGESIMLYALMSKISAQLNVSKSA